MRHSVAIEENPIARLEANVENGGQLFRTVGAFYFEESDQSKLRDVREMGSIDAEGNMELLVTDRARSFDPTREYEDAFKDVLRTGLKFRGVRREIFELPIRRFVKVAYNKLDLSDIVVFEDETGERSRTGYPIKYLSNHLLYETWD